MGPRSACLVEGVVAPLPGLAAHVEIHVGGAAAAAIGLRAAAPLALQVLQPRQRAPRRALHGRAPCQQRTSCTPYFHHKSRGEHETLLTCSHKVAAEFTSQMRRSVLQHIMQVSRGQVSFTVAPACSPSQRICRAPAEQRRLGQRCPRCLWWCPPPWPCAWPARPPPAAARSPARHPGTSAISAHASHGEMSRVSSAPLHWGTLQGPQGREGFCGWLAQAFPEAGQHVGLTSATQLTDEH